MWSPRRRLPFDDGAAASRATIGDPLEAEATTVIASPVTALAVFSVWATVGLVIAWAVARRGHDGRALGGLGFVLGPLFAGLAVHVVRREPSVAPVVVLDGGAGSGDCDVLVGLGGGGSTAADAVSQIAAIGDDVRRVTVAAVVDFESAERIARGEPDAAAADAVRELETAALFVADYEPSLVLLAGRPGEALCRYADRERYDVVVVTGSSRTVDAIRRRLVGDRRPTVLVAGEQRPLDR